MRDGEVGFSWLGLVDWWPAEWLLAALMEKKQTKPKWLSVEKEKNIIK